MTKFYLLFTLSVASLSFALAQEAPAPAAKPTEHVLGTITAMDASTQTLKVKDDKSGSEQTVLLADAKTLLKVTPGAKDLKSATRMTAGELAVGDRVDIRGSKSPDDPAKIAARSVVLMSARDLQTAHQAQAEEWKNSVAGVVTSLEAAAGKITIRERTPNGLKSTTLTTTPQTEFARYAPGHPTAPASSTLAQVQVGDQLRVIGDPGPEGLITARKVYSGAFP